MTSDDLKRYITSEYIANHIKWRRRNWYYYNDIKRLLNYYVTPDATVLQVGFDDGWLLEALKPKRATYLSLSDAALAAGKSTHPKTEFVLDANQNTVPLERQYEYILLVNTVGSMPDLLPYFERLHPVCHPRTRVIITYYNYLWQPLIKLAEMLGIKQRQPTQNWLSEGDMHNLLDLAGFEPIKHGRRLLLPVYIPLVSFFVNRIIGRLPIIDRLSFWNYVIARPKPISKGRYSVSVIIPARNERGNIEPAVRRIPDMGNGTEIIFIEGHSSDGTWEEIQRVTAAFENTKKIIAAVSDGNSKGAAVRKGFSLATGDVLMILDSDLTVPPEDLPRFYDVIASRHGEYVHGTRLVYPMEKGAMRFLNLIGNKFFSLAFSWLLRQRVKDTLCGTKVMFKKDYELLARNRVYFGDFDPFGDFDLIFGASKLALKMVEIPVHYKDRTYGTTNISRFRHGLILLRMTLFAAMKLE